MNNTVVGIFAHVDAGKTTLAEALLFKAGASRSLGKVDRGNTVMDSHHLEKERGITIFTSGAVFDTARNHISLLDTPGHVDFSSEAERAMGILDYAILVISGLDGVQPHTKTVWNMLGKYNVPVFIFVTKMDFARKAKEELMSDLTETLSPACTDFTDGNRNENVALCDDALLDKYLEGQAVTDNDVSRLISQRKIFPCYFGSGLKDEGIDDFLSALDTFIQPVSYRTNFGAKCFKITTDEKGNLLSHLKITGGSLKVRDTVEYKEKKEKAAQIRVYSGPKFTTRDEVYPGEICAVTGLTDITPGTGLGFEQNAAALLSEPVMKYNVILPADCDRNEYLPKLMQLSREDPMLSISADNRTGSICINLMGDVQTEIIKSIIRDRFGISVGIEHGRVLYKETINEKVEGVGHYEPLRHYAEVHLLIEPAERGSGISFASVVSEDYLDKNWQRLILTHLEEKEHRGILTGSPLTDVKITLCAGKAHLKHTEGGDFRQATYRAVRQGLMQAENVLLEPYYHFTIEVPSPNTGRAITDVKMMSGSIGDPVISGNTTILKGTAPVTEINGYASEIAAYTGGCGKIYLDRVFYDTCHNSEEVIKAFGYNCEADTENTPDSVFCSHGSGFVVKWNDVPAYMHLESYLKKNTGDVPLQKRNFRIDDKELQAIMEKEFGKVEYKLMRNKPSEPESSVSSVYEERRQYVIVDGYNIIFAWDFLRNLAGTDLGAARESLIQILSNYAAFTKNEVILVFDAYKVPGNPGEKSQIENIKVVYTKEQQLGDIYIEKLISEIGKNDKVRVVTSDGLIQLSAVRKGVLRMSAREFETEIRQVGEKINEIIEKIRETSSRTKIGDLPGNKKD